MKKITKINDLYSESLSCIYKKDTEKLNNFIPNIDVLNYQDKDEKTLLFHAILEKNIDVVDILLKKGAKVNIKDKNGWTPLHYAVNEHLMEISKLLLNYGADVNSKDSYGNSVIWRSVFASKGRGEIIELLLLNDANPNIENNSGISALSLAENIGNYDIKQFFKS